MRSIDPSLLAKIKEQNQTIYNNANPSMEVAIARAKTTVVDYTYWTTETIRKKEGLGDISVAPRRFKSNGPPNRIYEIHLDNGEVKTTLREYPDKLKDGWKHQFSLGDGISVGIAFNGYWERYRKLWRLITDEKPWIFWVDSNGKLWTQYWDEVDTKLELSTDVTYTKAIRAWKNVNFADQDQGIVVGYVKTDGTVWYRNYCQQADKTYAWENERQLTEFTEVAVHLNLFITNDYRMGFIIEDSQGQVYWLITGRNWAGMAIAAEYIFASVSGKIELIEIEKIASHNVEYISASVSGVIVHLYALSDNSIRKIENIPITMLDENEEEYENWGFRILAKLEHDLTNPNYLDFKLKDANNMLFVATKITKIAKKEYLLETANFNNSYGDLTLFFDGSGNTKGEAEQSVDSFSRSFVPTNLVPTFAPLPEVEAIWNE